MADNPADIRREYGSTSLTRADLHADPLEQFRIWFEAATAAELLDATAMTLATTAADGMPEARIVLLKGCDADGFVWYTDYNSAKGRALAADPRAALLFYWRELERQVRISGHVEKVSAAQSAEYFASRPLESRLSAAASEQSQPIDDRALLEARVTALTEAHPDGAIPAPADWGGYRLKPVSYEFWQGRTGRLHDRFRYRLVDGEWQVVRLQP